MPKQSENIQVKLLEILETLPRSQQQKVLDFAESLSRQNLVRKWDNISDEAAAELKAEFAAEDIVFSEAILQDYLPILQQEDSH